MEKTIVVIDDDKTVTDSIKTFLVMNTDYQVITFNEPVEALEELKDEKNIKAVLCDLIMNGMNGIKLLKNLRQYHPDVPMIILTGYADKANTIKAINEVSLYYYLEKPWNNDELLLIINNALEKENLVSELKSKMEELRYAYKQLEEAQQEIIKSEKLAAVGSMASKIIHDLKNPMTSISGFAELIMKVTENNSKKEKDEDQQETFKEIKEFANIIKGEVRRLVGMVTEVLNYSKGEESYYKTRQPLTAVIKQTIAGIKDSFKEKDITIIYNDSQDDLIFKMDDEKIKRMLYNMLYNSKEAMPDGGEIIIETSKIDNNHIKLSIIDNGTGIPDEIKPKIYEPFVTYGKSGGTGLGMAIVKKIADAHNAQIKVESEINKGTRFDIIFDLNE